MWLVLLLDDYRIADIILLMLLPKVKVMDFENSVMFRSKFYLKFLSIAYNSVATDQKLFIFGMGVHLWTPGSCPRAGLEVKI